MEDIDKMYVGYLERDLRNKTAEVENLQHDVDRHIAIVNEHTATIEELIEDLILAQELLRIDKCPIDRNEWYKKREYLLSKEY